ncbi:hypothetical protein [Carbonactinospora thermoautotrophica]|uniref:hypothetical protein n=1 Tax=Carbonactinospora thermoautotrophica TaxID=1469144 RepID=UPI000833DAB0|nr:hypothetical protein [Carbonactinospora thermoautotrophica]
MKIVFLAFTTTRSEGVCNDLAWVADQGDEAVLVTVRFQSWPEVDPRARVIDLADGEARHPIPRIERLILFRIPRLGFRFLAAVLRRIGRIPVLGRPARSAGGKVPAMLQRYERFGITVHRRAYLPVYRHLRPYVLWRVARKAALRQLGLDSADLVVVADTAALPLGWHIARRYPDLPVKFTLDRTLWEKQRTAEAVTAARAT